MRKLAGNLVLLLGTVLVTAWILDLVLVVKPPKDYMARRTELRRQAARNAGLEFDGRSQSEVARDLRNAGTDAWPAVSALNVSQQSPGLVDTLFPLGGIAGVTTVLCGELGRHVLYQADRFGFRNPPEAWTGPRVVLVGDSYSAGMCVADSLSPGDALRRRGIPALAVAFRGASPVFELGLLREYVAPLRPAVVLWVYYEGNDLDELNESQSAILRRYFDSTFSQRLSERQAEVDTLLRNWVTREEARIARAEAAHRPEPATRTAAKVIKLYHLRRLFTAITGPRPDVGEPRLPLLDSVLTAARDAVTGWGGSLRFVYVPAPHDFGRRGLENVLGIHSYDQVKAIACRLGLPVLDLRQRLTARPDADSLFPSPAFDGVHFSDYGFRVFGEELAGFVEQDGTDCTD